MRTLSFSGTPAQIGEAFGESCREAIAELYANRLRNAIAQAEVHGGRRVGEAAVLEVAAACIEATRLHHRAGFEELEGIARGADLPLVKVLAMNGLTDIRDVLAWGGELESLGGCTAFVVAGDHTKSGELICGQSWDLATDNMPYVLAVHRQPTQGPQTWCLTTVGCLSLIGCNEHGIAVGTTNIRTVDARPGVTYLSLIHKALAARDLEAATAAIADAPRAGAHFFYVADGQGRAQALECTPRLVDRVEVETGAYVHTNHCLVAAHQAIEGNTPSASSHARSDRLEQMIAASAGTASLETSKRWLADRTGGENAISRTDFNGISSNGAVVMQPQSGRIEACHGPPHAVEPAQWLDLRAAT